MANISGYPVRATVTGTDRIFVATATSDQIQSCTLAQVAGLSGSSGGGGSGGSGSGGPAFAPGWGRAYVPGTGWHRPALSSLSWFNQGSAVAADISGGPIHLTQSNVAGVSQWSILAVTVNDADPFIVDMMLEIDGYGGAHGGMIVGDSATGNFYSFDLFSGNAQFYVTEWTGMSTSASATTTYAGNQANRAVAGSPTQIWLRVKYAANGITFYTSYNPLDDASWLAFEAYTVAAGNFLVAVDTVGFGVCNGNAATPATINLWGLFQTSP